MPGHFDLIAHFYDRFAGSPKVNRLTALLDLPASGLLLDAGGGTGRVGRTLRPHVDALIVVDEAHGMMKEAAAAEVGCPVRSAAEGLPFPDGTFARAVVVDAFHHFADQRAAVRELVRVLAPGGRLVIEEPDVTRFVVKLVALGERLLLMRSHFLTAEEIAELARVSGARVRVERDRHDTAWVVVEK